MPWPFDALSPFPAVGSSHLRADSPLRTIADRVRASLPGLYRGASEDPYGELPPMPDDPTYCEPDVAYEPTPGGPPVPTERVIIRDGRRLIPVGDPNPALRRVSAVGDPMAGRHSTTNLVPMGRAPDEAGYITRELAPGVEIRARKGIDIAAVNVGSAEVPVFLLTPGAKRHTITAGVGPRRPYVGALPLLLLLAKPVGKAIKNAVEHGMADPDSEEHHEDGPGKVALEAAQETLAAVSRPKGTDLTAVVAALLIDSDGYRKRT